MTSIWDWSGTEADPFNVVSESILLSIRGLASKVNLYGLREIRMEVQ